MSFVRNTSDASIANASPYHGPASGIVDAAFAAGNGTLLSAPSFARRQEATPGLPATGETKHVKGEGRFGDALRFTTRRKPLVFFEGGANVPYRSTDWSGTVSFWLSVDPAAERRAVVIEGREHE